MKNFVPYLVIAISSLADARKLDLARLPLSQLDKFELWVRL